jgi:NADH-quinone oxidoreductase subunit J
MAGSLSFLSAAGAPGAAQNALSPVLILVLCVIAGAATVLLLPGDREATFRKVGGAVLLATGLIFAAMVIHYTGGLNIGGMSVFFWLFSAIAIVGAVRVVTHPRPVYSALYFILVVMAGAGLFVLLWAEFMAAALVIIYAGAILVTYVFVIMLATHSSVPGSPDSGMGAIAEYDANSREPVVACAVGFTLMGVLLFVIFDRAPADPGATVAGTAQAGTVQAVGRYLFNNQLVNLELAGLILTVSMVGAIVIARRRVETAGPRVHDVMVGPATPIDDNPHSIPVYGTENPRAKAYPET